MMVVLCNVNDMLHLGPECSCNGLLQGSWTIIGGHRRSMSNVGCIQVAYGPVGKSWWSYVT